MMASSGTGDAHAREIATGLAAAVRSAIATTRQPEAPTAPSLAWAAAADIAELLDLPGLAALLTACTGAPATAPLDRALNRLARLADEAESRGDVGAFASADRELATLAASAGLAWRAAVTAESTAAPTPASPGPGSSAPAETAVAEDVRSLDVLLTDFAFDDPSAVA